MLTEAKEQLLLYPDVCVMVVYFCYTIIQTLEDSSFLRMILP